MLSYVCYFIQRQIQQKGDSSAIYSIRGSAGRPSDKTRLKKTVFEIQRNRLNQEYRRHDRGI